MTLPRAPESIETERLLLRRPAVDDAEAVFSCYASDAEVTKYLGWPRHINIEDTRTFISLSEQIWERRGVGPKSR